MRYAHWMSAFQSVHEGMLQPEFVDAAGIAPADILAEPWFASTAPPAWSGCSTPMSTRTFPPICW